MKKITIIGDSNGAGEWVSFERANKDQNNFFRQHIVPPPVNSLVEIHPGLDLYLDEMGYSCINFSMGAQANILSLSNLEASLMLRHPRHGPRFINPDIIVWLVTEPLRDVIHLNDTISLYKDHVDKIKECIEISNSLSNLNMLLLENSMKIANRVYELTKIPYIIVEGLSKTYDLEKKYDFCVKKIDNWIGEAAGMDVPMIGTNVVFHKIMEKLTKMCHISQIEEYMDSYEIWRMHLNGHEKFPDSVHPDRTIHKELALKINDFIINNQ